ncbi:RAD55 family ATPase [Halorussus caseinilyticus]|uniref:RAD55 family ATPase n=1 Tax=Halorussus caseinilyticus TaxID=3034025 RepID=A0ABD5WPJ4_9EURY|nr:ATPase domain-containing protein [Halorussus sp. DT72]
MPVSTGSDVLDRILDGGFPTNRSILLSGGPGVGKSTLAMQFLQEGLADGDQCLYVSTEQTAEELRASFDQFDFELDHPNLTLVHIHARTGRTIEDGEQNLTMQTTDGDEVLGEGYSAPFEMQYIEEYLSRFAPCDRVVFDSTASLAGIESDSHFFQRAILDLVRLFTDEFEATSLLTAESLVPESGEDDPGGQLAPETVLEFSTHGVIRLRRSQVEGNPRRFLRVVKMRGIDHDTREYELGIGESGVYLTPHNRTHDFGVNDDDVISTGFEGLDEISGGLTKGSGVLIEHDGRAFVDGLVVGMAASALDSGMGIWLVPSPSLTPSRFESMLPAGEDDIPTLLASNSLFVLDSFNVWKAYNDHQNVYAASSSGLISSILTKSSTMSMAFVKRVLQDITSRRDRPVLALVYTEAFLRWFDAPQVRELYYWARENVSFDADTVTYIHNPETMETNLAEFFVYDAQHMFRTWKHENDIQYVKAEKSLAGTTKSMGVVNHVDSAPFVEVTRPTK